MLYDTFIFQSIYLSLQRQNWNSNVFENPQSMKLIADSGSTKTAWKLMGPSGEIKNIKTSGLNPYTQSEESISLEIEKHLLPETGTNIQEIYFFGAGIVNAEKGDLLKKILNRFYPDATIETHSDVLGAARALFGNEPGIACILGTGSNVCLYDGEIITGGISPLGYILGDEGSGSVMGRKLLGDYFKEVMPPSLREEFTNKYHLTREEALTRVYRTEKANQFMAQFTPFLSEHIDTSYCQEFVRQNFTDFFERNVCKIPGYLNYQIGFIGSIAWHFSPILNQTAKHFGFGQTSILKDPIDGLAKYYSEKK